MVSATPKITLYFKIFKDFFKKKIIFFLIFNTEISKKNRSTILKYRDFTVNNFSVFKLLLLYFFIRQNA